MQQNHVTTGSIDARICRLSRDVQCAGQGYNDTISNLDGGHRVGHRNRRSTSHNTWPPNDDGWVGTEYGIRSGCRKTDDIQDIGRLCTGFHHSTIERQRGSNTIRKLRWREVTCKANLSCSGCTSELEGVQSFIDRNLVPIDNAGTAWKLQNQSKIKFERGAGHDKRIAVRQSIACYCYQFLATSQWITRAEIASRIELESNANISLSSECSHIDSGLSPTSIVEYFRRNARPTKRILILRNRNIELVLSVHVGIAAVVDRIVGTEQHPITAFASAIDAERIQRRSTVTQSRTIVVARAVLSRQRVIEIQYGLIICGIASQVDQIALQGTHGTARCSHIVTGCIRHIGVVNPRPVSRLFVRTGRIGKSEFRSAIAGKRIPGVVEVGKSTVTCGPILAVAGMPQIHIQR